ncbi:MAG: sulfatase-like hydrolase/transferase [Planctomycetota bacterium]
MEGARGGKGAEDRGRAVVAAMAGASLAGALHAFLFPALLGGELLSVKLMTVLSGNLLAALLLALLLALPLPWFSRARRALGFWAGFAAGAGAWGASWLGWPAAFFPLVALSLLGVPRAIRRGAPPHNLNLALATTTVVLLAGLAMGLGVRPAKHFRPQDRPALPADPGTPLPPGPDVLLVSIDTLRADALRDGSIATPVFDQLRRTSLWSEIARAPAGATLPSHATLLTGTGVLAHGALENRAVLPPDLPMLAERFHAAGWSTLGLVSNSVLRSTSGFDRGFEIYENLAASERMEMLAKRLRRGVLQGAWLARLLPGRALEKVFSWMLLRRIPEAALRGEAGGELVTRTGLAYLNDLLARKRPYFFFLHYMDPHAPYAPAGEGAAGLPGVPPMPEAFRTHSEGSQLQVNAVRDAMKQGDPQAPTAAARLEALYLREVEGVDGELGRILERVRASGRPTVVLVTAGHGEQFGEHGMMMHSNSLYEVLLRVPFFLSGPGVEPGPLSAPPLLEDVAPTLLGLCGLSADGLPGRDLRAGRPSPAVLAAASPLQAALIQDGWKLIADRQKAGAGSPVPEPKELYDLAADPGEKENLLAREPERGAAMNARLQGLLAKARATASVPLSATRENALDELGY